MKNNSYILGITAFFSILAHAALILGVSFIYPDQYSQDKTPNSLDVVLVNNSNSLLPQSADFLANKNNRGDSQSAAIRPSPLNFDSAETDQVFQAHNQSQSNSLTISDQFITAKHATVQLLLPRHSETKLLPRLQPTTLQSNERAQLITKLNQQWQELQNQPSKEYLSPTTKRHQAALYLEQWRKKVERIGNQNYPSSALNHSLSGSLILTVEINRDGSLASIVINHASKHQVLNEAAITFVRRAAPFAHFPKEIDANTDVLVITRAFHFLENNALTSSDALRDI